MFYLEQFPTYYFIFLLALLYLAGITFVAVKVYDKIPGNSDFFYVKNYSVSDKLLESSAICYSKISSCFYFLKKILSGISVALIQLFIRQKKYFILSKISYLSDNNKSNLVKIINLPPPYLNW